MCHTHIQQQQELSQALLHSQLPSSSCELTEYSPSIHVQVHLVPLHRKLPLNASLPQYKTNPSL
jgi:hypothetical protein